MLKKEATVPGQNKTILDKASPHTADQTAVLGMKTKVNNKAVLIYANELEALSNHSSVAKLRGSLYKCGLTLISRDVLAPNPSLRLLSRYVSVTNYGFYTPIRKDYYQY